MNRKFHPSLMLSACVLPMRWVCLRDNKLYGAAVLLLILWWCLQHRGPRVRLGLMAAFLTVCLVIPLGQRFAEKRAGIFTSTHDGVYQAEYAVKLLLEGRNAYTEDTPPEVTGEFWRTIKFRPGWGRAYTMPNPVAHHYIYPPLFTMHLAPFYWICQHTLGWFDERIVLCLYLLGSLLIFCRLPLEENKKWITGLLLFFNPYFLRLFLDGRNDLVVFFWLFGSFWKLSEQKEGEAVWWLAVACLMKQAAWMVVPFVGLYLVQRWSGPGTLQALRRLAKAILLPGIFALAVMLPFMIWDFHSLWEDMILYPSGKLPTSFPVNGASLLAFLVRFGVLDSPFRYYPIVLVQIPVLLLCLYLTHRSLRQDCTLHRLLLWCSTGLALFWFLSRFYHDNYIEFTVRLFVVASLFKPQGPQPASPPPAEGEKALLASG
jgi:hypothetical protein